MIIISTNTVWAANTVTNLADDVQIAPGVTLTIEGGATINGNGHSLASFGKLLVTGTSSATAMLNNLKINFGSTYNNPGRIEIDHASITGGALFPATGNAVYGSFVVSNSVLKNTGSQYIWYPTGDSSFTGNVFLNSGGLGIGTNSGVTVRVTDNLFVGSTAGFNGTATIVSWAAYGNPVDVSRNTFLDTDHPALEVTIDGKMTATGNYFGTSDRATINSLILDRNDDLSRPAYIALQSIASGPSDVVRSAVAASGLADIIGTSGNDNLTGTAANDMIFGGDGDDYITDAGGSDILRGGSGNDRILISRVDNGTSETVRIEGGAGNDTVTYQNFRAGSASIDLGAGDDALTLWTRQSGGTTITTGTGQDVIELASSSFVTSGGAITITDFAAGSAGDRLALTEFLSSQLIGWDGSANPFGSTGYLRLVQVGADTLVQLDRDGAAASSYGWTTLMTLQSTSASALTSYNLSGFSGDGSPMPAVTITGTVGNDTLSGTGGSDTINGLDGSDTIDGGAGSDVIYGSAGNDTINGGPGDDLVDGGDGDDYITDAGGSDILRGGSGNDRILISRVDNGTSETVRIEGGAGNDTVTYQNFRAGSASIDLGAGDDALTLWTRQSGGTTITTGTGQDVIELASSSFVTSGGAITITDFAAGSAGDRLALTEFLSSQLIGWDGSANPFGSTGYLRLVQVGADTLVQLDRDGAAASSYGWTTLMTLQSTSASALTSYNLSGWTPRAVSGANIATAYVVAPTSVTEGVDSSFSLSVVLKNLSSANGTFTMSLAASSTAGATDVSVPSYVSSFSVAKSPAGDYVLTAPAITVYDDLVAEAGKTIDIQIKVSGQVFENGTDTTVLHIALVDGDQIGTAGNDELSGTTGKDLLQGGLGDDVYHVNNIADIVSEAANAGNDTVYSSIGHTLGANVENLVLRGTSAINGTGNELANALTGNAANNVLSGGEGDDRLATGGGRDIIDGGAGSDTLVLTGARNSYAVFTINGENYLIGNGEGVRVANVETVQFADERASWSSVMLSAQPFDTARYLATYPDLASLAASPQGVEDHFARYGFQEGRAAGSFDALQYIASNTDLIRAFGNNVDAATQHYIGTGLAEGRQTGSFDALEYLASNVDLIHAFGADTQSATNHYITSGLTEGRDTGTFDALAYLASNVDLIRAFGMDTDAAKRHYIVAGLAEGRQTESFNALEYIASNADLIRAFGTNVDAATQHYVGTGFAEGRQTESFDALEYIASNADLIRAFGTNVGAATQHYVGTGFAEGRETDSFDAEAYQAAHPELAGLSHDAVLTQYISTAGSMQAELYML